MSVLNFDDDLQAAFNNKAELCALFWSIIHVASARRSDILDVLVSSTSIRIARVPFVVLILACYDPSLVLPRFSLDA